MATVDGPFPARVSPWGPALGHYGVRKRWFGHTRLRSSYDISWASNMVYGFFAVRSYTPSPICFEPWMVSWVRLGPEQHPPMSSLLSLFSVYCGFNIGLTICYLRLNPLCCLLRVLSNLPTHPPARPLRWLRPRPPSAVRPPASPAPCRQRQQPGLLPPRPAPHNGRWLSLILPTMAFLQQLAMALSSIRGGPDADSPGSPRHGAGRPARVSILPGDPPANEASVEGSPGSFGSGGMGIGLTQYVMSQPSQPSQPSDTYTLLGDEFLSSLSHEESTLPGDEFLSSIP